MMTHPPGRPRSRFFGARFQSKGLRIAAAAIIFVFLIPYTASVYNGLSLVRQLAFGPRGVRHRYGGYHLRVRGAGRLHGPVMNDFIQGIVMLLGIVAVIVAVLVNNGGFTEALTTCRLFPPRAARIWPGRSSSSGRTCPISSASSF